PTCAAPSATGSLEHASSTPLPPTASNQMRGTLPSLVTSSEPLRQFFIASIPFVEPRPARRKGALERLTTEIGGHGASSYSGQTDTLQDKSDGPLASRCGVLSQERSSARRLRVRHGRAQPASA